jgi:hypothetical protein
MTLTALILLCAQQTAQVTPEYCLSLFVDRPGITELSGELLARPHADALAAARALTAPALIREIPEVRELLLRAPEGLAEREWAAALLATGLFEYVVPNWTVYPANTPNDPLFGSQWHHQTIRSEAGWDWITDTSAVIAAFTDTGVDLGHPDLAASLVPGYNTVENLPQAQGGSIQDVNGHGTCVAGTIGAIGNNGAGVAGVCWNVKLMPIRVSNSSSGSSTIADLEEGARWAAENGAKTVSASYTGVQTPSLDVTGAYVRSLGALYFYAADNYAQNHSSFDWLNVIVVAATDQSDNRAWFSSYGLAIDCAGPGVDIWCSTLGGGYGPASGTSFSTPMTNGVAATIYAINPYLTPAAVEERLFRGTDDLGAPGEDDIYGRGRINLEGAVLQAAGGTMDLAVLNLTAGQTAAFTASGAAAGAKVWFAYSTAGTALTPIPQASVVLALGAPALLGAATADGAGVATLQRPVPGGAQGMSVWFQAASVGDASNFVAATVN